MASGKDVAGLPEVEQMDCIIEYKPLLSGTPLSLKNMLYHNDASVARGFLSGGKNLRDRYKRRADRGVTIYGNDEISNSSPSLGVANHTERISSLKRCVAACALYCLRWLREKMAQK